MNDDQDMTIVWMNLTIQKHAALIDGLVEALEDLIPRFERAAKAMGSDDEFIAGATRMHREVLELARQP